MVKKNKFTEAAAKAEERRVAAAEAKKQEAEAKKEKAKVDAIKAEIKPIDDAAIQDAMKLIEDGKVHVIRDKNGNAVSLSKSGHGVVLDIPGMPHCFVGGVSQKDVENGVKAAIFHHFSQQNLGKVDIAEQLVDSGASVSDVKDIGDSKIINFKNRTVIDTTSGEVVADLSDIKEKLSRETVEKLLKERLGKVEPDYDDDEDEDDDDYDCCDDCDRCNGCDEYDRGYEDGDNDAYDENYHGDNWDSDGCDKYQEGYKDGFTENV